MSSELVIRDVILGRAQQANSPRPHKINHCRFLLAHQHVICQISSKSTAIGWYLNYLMLKALIFPDKNLHDFSILFLHLFSNFKKSLQELIINRSILYYNIDFITNFQGAIFFSLKEWRKMQHCKIFFLEWYNICFSADWKKLRMFCPKTKNR